MKYLLSYIKTGKTLQKGFENLKDWMDYLNSLKENYFPIKCQYSKVLNEDVKCSGMVYEKGDILCSFDTEGRRVMHFIIHSPSDFCNMTELKIIDSNLEGVCNKLKKSIKILLQ